MVAIVPITNRGQITIPAPLRKSLRLTIGKKLLITKTGSSLLVKPIKEMDDVMRLYGSIDPKGRSSSPEVAINQAKQHKAKRTAEQGYGQ